MKVNHRQRGLTLMEMTVVILIVALLTSLSLPAIRTFFSSMAMSDGAKGMISAALASARAIAAKEQRYAGVRFQTAYRPDGPLNAPQYMIFVVHDFDNTGLAPGFRAVEGIKPIKLPENVGVMDLRYRTNANPIYSGDAPIDENSDIDSSVPERVRDTTSFSIVFSPSGKLVLHDVRVRNRDGETNNNSQDDIFNTVFNVEVAKIATFYQDDYADLGNESSRSSFVMYDKERFRQMNPNRRWSDYLSRLEVIYINSYTGRMISRD